MKIPCWILVIALLAGCATAPSQPPVAPPNFCTGLNKSECTTKVQDYTRQQEQIEQKKHDRNAFLEFIGSVALVVALIGL